MIAYRTDSARVSGQDRKRTARFRNQSHGNVDTTTLFPHVRLFKSHNHKKVQNAALVFGEDLYLYTEYMYCYGVVEKQSTVTDHLPIGVTVVAQCIRRTSHVPNEMLIRKIIFFFIIYSFSWLVIVRYVVKNALFPLFYVGCDE